MTNIFLTGERHVGKSTIINKVLSEMDTKVAGFKTLPLYADEERMGFYIQSVFEDESNSGYPLISKKIVNDDWLPIHETFDNEGVRILKKSLVTKPDIILMDELGFLENNAADFQKLVGICLDTETVVLGVIKPMNTPFLNAIRERQDTMVFEVTSENRAWIYKDIKAQIEKKLVKQLVK